MSRTCTAQTRYEYLKQFNACGVARVLLAEDKLPTDQ